LRLNLPATLRESFDVIIHSWGDAFSGEGARIARLGYILGQEENTNFMCSETLSGYDKKGYILSDDI